MDDVYENTHTPRPREKVNTRLGRGDRWDHQPNSWKILKSGAQCRRFRRLFGAESESLTSGTEES